MVEQTIVCLKQEDRLCASEYPEHKAEESHSRFLSKDFFFQFLL